MKAGSSESMIQFPLLSLFIPMSLHTLYNLSDLRQLWPLTTHPYCLFMWYLLEFTFLRPQKNRQQQLWSFGLWQHTIW